MKTLLLVSLSLFLPLLMMQGIDKKPQEKPEIKKPLKRPSFPRHWGPPPKIQVRDHVKLPGKFGHGSSTLSKWVADNIKKDIDKGKPTVKPKPKPKPRPEPSPEIKEKMKLVHEKQKEMSGIRKDFHEILKASKDLTKENRDQMIKEFKEANAEKHNAIKEAQKALQKEIREIKQDGDRRK